MKTLEEKITEILKYHSEYANNGDMWKSIGEQDFLDVAVEIKELFKSFLLSDEEIEEAYPIYPGLPDDIRNERYAARDAIKWARDEIKRRMGL